jgi:GNAT superfamily N-acetyltransferase
MSVETIEVRRTYLQMLDQSELRRAPIEDTGVRIEQAVECPAHFFRYLYREVGRNYHWIDRLGWTDEEIRAYLDQESVSLWVMYCEGVPAGYFELRRHADDSVELAYFGLLPEFIGRGLGKHLLTSAVERAWSNNPVRIWLHTCTLDDPAAMPNYLQRGFKPFREETYTTEISRP